MGKKDKQEELLKTLGDFTSKENWDKFFSIRGSDDSFEWYAEWPQLKAPLLSHLRSNEQLPPVSPAAPGATLESSSSSPPEVAAVQILVPGCGNSRLSEHLYDAGFHGITNIDFSKVVISDMLRRNVRSRPGMRWRVMDMTNMQFSDESFDVVVDKGGLDALMEPELGSKLGNKYLSEVKRVLKSGGRFICLTLAESHVLGLLFPKFRCGWKMSLHVIPQKPSGKPGLQTFMVIAEKYSSAVLDQISSLSNPLSLDSRGYQARGLIEALETENKIRTEYSNGSDVLYSLEELKLGVKGDISELSPGRRLHLCLGEEEVSRFCYRAVLLDAQQQSCPFAYNCGVFLVPKTRAHEWLFTSEEGQWLIVESSKTARLVMVFLDAVHTSASMDEIQKDLSPLVKQLAPGINNNGAQIPFMAAGDGLKQRKIVHQVTSALTGPIVIDDVEYEKVDDELRDLFPSRDLIFRRLTFERAETLVQSEALLATENSPSVVVGESQQKESLASSRPGMRGNQRKNDPQVSLSDESRKHLKVDHNFLSSSYHTGIVSGFMLISSYLESAASTGRMVKATVIGLGAGIIPMFLHKCFPFLHIEVVELDPVVFSLATDYFGFKEDEHLKVHVTDGILFVQEIAKPKTEGATVCDRENDVLSNGKPLPSNGSNSISYADGTAVDKIDILIVDADSSDSSSGLACPAPDFVEESFLLTAKNSLSEQGLFVVNLVSRSVTMKASIVSRIKKVFGNLFSLQLEQDVNEVLFALNTVDCIKEDCFPEASCQLEKLLDIKYPEWSQRIIDITKKIKSVK